MDAERQELLVRAASFGEVAEAYERARPGYPRDAVRWLAGEEPCDVLDLGAGTGKLTRSLVALGHRVTAVEPLEGMLEQLRRAVPAATALRGSAEEIPVAGGSVDVVTCAQAFHWFDHGPALVEIARVLRPAGRLAVLWNARDDRVAWVRDLSVIIGEEDARGGEQGRFGPLERYDAVFADGPFEHVEQATFAHDQRLTREALRDLVLSRSACAVLTPEERAPVLSEIDVLFEAHAEDGALVLPYVTVCFRSRSTASA
jgi:SAM-dependent methyltransferase